MLTLDQVLRLVTHQDRDLRYRAAERLRICPTMPSNTADVFWEAFDRYGLGESSVGHAYAEIPQTESSCRRLVDAVANGRLTRDTGHFLRPALERLPLDFLAAHQDEVFSAAARLPDEELQFRKKRKPRMSVDDHLRERLTLQTATPQQLWDDLQQLSVRVDRLARSEWDWRQDYRLMEALARHPHFVIEKCVPLLANEHEWLGVFALELLGLVRHQPSLDLLMVRLDDPLNCDFEAAMTLLAQIGGDDVLDRLLREFADRNCDDRGRLLHPIGRLGTPAAEQALIQLLRSGTLVDDELDYAANELVDMFTTDGIDVLCDQVRQESYNPGYSELREDVLMLGEACGVLIPEAQQWREEIETRKAAWRARSPLQRMRSMFGRRSGDAEESLALPEVQPVVREPKAGRNDPCPCGSGKKYKKCCLNA